MSNDPKDVIEAAIHSAFDSYPKEDDPDWRSSHWITPKHPHRLVEQIRNGKSARREMGHGFERQV
jgi:hypothetical protein